MRLFRRFEAEQENDQKEDDQDCAHGLFNHRYSLFLIGYFFIRVLKGHISEICVWGAATRWGKRKPLYAGTVLAIRTAF